MHKKTLYISQITGLQRKDNNLIIINNDKKYRVPINTVSSIVITKDITISSKLLYLLGRYNIPLHFLGYYGNYIGSFYGKERNTKSLLLIKQVNFFLDNKIQLELIRKLLDSSFYNIIQNLNRVDLKNKVWIYEVKQYRHLLMNPELDIQGFLGIEGNVRKLYYGYWEEILKGKYEFKKRVKQPPDNIVNILISFINTLCYTYINDKIMVSGLSPSISFYHSSLNKRYSLNLDIAEIFKPILVDRLIFNLLNNRIITEKDFEKDKKNSLLKIKKESIKKILTKWEEQKGLYILYKDQDKKFTWDWIITLEVNKVKNFLLNGEDFSFYKIYT